MITIETIKWLFDKKTLLSKQLQSNPKILENRPEAAKFLDALFTMNEADFHSRKEAVVASIQSMLHTELSSVTAQLLILNLSIHIPNKIPTDPFQSFVKFIAIELFPILVYDPLEFFKLKVKDLTIKLHSIYAAKPSLLNFIVDIVLPLWVIFLQHPWHEGSSDSLQDILKKQKFPEHLISRYNESECVDFQNLFLNCSLGGPSGIYFQERPSESLPTKILELARLNCPTVLDKLDKLVSPAEKSHSFQETFAIESTGPDTKQKRGRSLPYVEIASPPPDISTELVAQLMRVLLKERTYIEYFYKNNYLPVTQQLAQHYIESFLKILRDHLGLSDDDTFETSEHSNIIIQSFMQNSKENLRGFLKEKGQEIRQTAKIQPKLTEQTIAQAIDSYLNVADQQSSPQTETLANPLLALTTEPQAPLTSRPDTPPTEPNSLTMQAQALEAALSNLSFFRNRNGEPHIEQSPRSRPPSPGKRSRHETS